MYVWNGVRGSGSNVMFGHQLSNTLFLKIVYVHFFLAIAENIKKIAFKERAKIKSREYFNMLALM